MEKEDERFNELIINKCPECGGVPINTTYEIICRDCGLILGEILKDASYQFEDLDARSNMSKQFVALGNRTDFVGGLGSFIDYENTRLLRDKFGRLLPPNEQKLYKRLKEKYSTFIRIKDHETEYRILNILNKISIYLKLNKNIKNNAAYYYKKILRNEKKVINNISLIAFCIFYAAREENHNAPITINEIARAFQNFGHRVNPRLILRDGLTYKKYLNKETKHHKSEDYMVRLINQVINYDDLDDRLKKKEIKWSKFEYEKILTFKCKKILQNLSYWERGGRNPFILMGAIIYLADKLIGRDYNQKTVLTQKIISQATGIAEYSIRDHYVNLLKPLFIKN